MATNKYAKVSLGTIEAVLNKLGGLEGVAAFLRGETKIVPAFQTFDVEVDYDDPQWKVIDPHQYYFVGDVNVADYPETESGKRRVRFREFDLPQDLTDAEILGLLNEAGCRLPSRAEAENFIRGRFAPDHLAEQPRIALIARKDKSSRDRRRVFVDFSEGGVKLNAYYAGPAWNRHCRIIAVCKK